MSQAQLAGHDLSDSYISLIESGKRTPTPAVLRLLAERLGCTAEYLAEGIEPEQRAHLEVRERHARLALLSGDAETAMAGFDDVIERSDDPDLTVRARWGRARALEEMGHTEDAIRIFESLREQAERDPGRASALPVLIALARCYHTVGDLGQAIALAERVLSRLHGLGLTVGQEHTEAARVLLLAYADRSAPDRAHDLSRQVLTDGEITEAGTAEAYRRASAQALEQGIVGDALYFAERAIAAHGEGVRTQATARLQLAAARAMLRGLSPYDLGAPATVVPQAVRRDAAQEALRLLRAAAPGLSGAEAATCTIETARALVLLDEPEQAIGAVEPQLGDTETVEPDARLLEHVQAQLVIARARLAQGERDAALTVLRASAMELDRATPGRAAAHALRELGELFQGAGDNVGATTAYRQALEAAGLRPSSRPQPAHDLGRV